MTAGAAAADEAGAAGDGDAVALAEEEALAETDGDGEAAAPSRVALTDWPEPLAGLLLAPGDGLGAAGAVDADVLGDGLVEGLAEAAAAAEATDCDTQVVPTPVHSSTWRSRSWAVVPTIASTC